MCSREKGGTRVESHAMGHDTAQKWEMKPYSKERLEYGRLSHEIHGAMA